METVQQPKPKSKQKSELGEKNKIKPSLSKKSSKNVELEEEKTLNKRVDDMSIKNSTETHKNIKVKSLQNNSLSTPVINVANKEQANCEELSFYVSSQDVCLLRGLCHLCNFRLDLFSTSSLRKQHGDFTMEIRIQPRKVSAKHTKHKTETHEARLKGTQRSWHFPSHPSSMNINNYAKYQALTFVKAKLQQINEKPSKNVSMKKEYINFATNLDLSSPKLWHQQINEVNKLPDFLKVHCPDKNMLNHIGHNVLGVNTIQLYMKVPGARTTGHQENNNFAAINVNVGPGSCEWYCVPKQFWSQLASLCKKRGLNEDSSAWWPDLQDLRDEAIPLHHVLQLPGDVVYVGPGTAHWVQALGWCNNIAWNVGPFSAFQYNTSMHRYNLNKEYPLFKSIVPMIQLTWNLMFYFLGEDGNEEKDDVQVNQRKHFFTPDYQDLLEEMVKVLQSEAEKMSALVQECADLDRPLIQQKRLPTDLAHYCTICYVEVFNILFASKNVVFCRDCAIKRSSNLKDFYVLVEYQLSHLQSSLKSFQNKVSCIDS